MWKLLVLSIAMTSCGNVASDSHGVDGGMPADSADSADSAAPGSDAHACTQNTCTGGMLQVCNASGVVDHTETCALGCFTDGSRCFSITPSNDLGAALEQAAQQSAITLPAGAVVDSDTGAVTSAQQAPIVVSTLTVAQTGGATLRVLLAKSWSLNDVRVRGSLPVAFVSSDDIKLQGILDVSADGNTNGAGGLVCGAGAGGGGVASNAHFERAPAGSSAGYPTFIWVAGGSGGGGFGSPGGLGGVQGTQPTGSAGQATGNTELVPLRGGCEGGGNMPQTQGAGGGAVQLVAGRAVHLLMGGIVHVGGGRGAAGALGVNNTSETTPMFAPGGGGAGGGILIEAPSVILDGGAALLAGGGGGGGWGACAPLPDGLDAPPSAAAGSGGTCPAGVNPTAAGGDGATTTAGASGTNASSGSAGGGGGGLGRVRINTADGLYTADANSRIRATTTTGTVNRH